MSNNKIINWWLLPDNVFIEASSYYWDFQLDTVLRAVTNMNTFVDNVASSVTEFFDPFGTGREEGLDEEYENLSLQIEGQNNKNYSKLADFEKDLRSITQLTPVVIHMESSVDSPNFSTIILQKTGNMKVWD